MTVYSANTSHDCRTRGCVIEDILALFGEIIELHSKRSAEGGIHSQRIWSSKYRILQLSVDDILGNTVPYREARFERSIQNADTSLSAPGAIAHFNY